MCCLEGIDPFAKTLLPVSHRLSPPLQVFGKENIPSIGPCLLTFNHYSRPDFNAWWIALAVASQLPMDAHFVMTDELTSPGKRYSPGGDATQPLGTERGREGLWLYQHAAHAAA